MPAHHPHALRADRQRPGPGETQSLTSQAQRAQQQAAQLPPPYLFASHLAGELFRVEDEGCFLIPSQLHDVILLVPGMALWPLLPSLLGLSALPSLEAS